MLKKQKKRIRRHRRVRAKIEGTGKKPRLCVFRSANHIYAELINDEKGITLASASDLEIKKSLSGRQADKKSSLAFQVGELIAQKAQKKKIKKIVFDRGGYKYHGRVKALADAARKAGLEF